MNVFFELADGVVEEYGHKYLALYNVRKSAVIGGAHRRLMLHSNRVWVEDDEGVRLMKDRWDGITDKPVDLKEFFWIKLRSVSA